MLQKCLRRSVHKPSPSDLGALNTANKHHYIGGPISPSKEQGYSAFTTSMASIKLDRFKLLMADEPEAIPNTNSWGSEASGSHDNIEVSKVLYDTPDIDDFEPLVQPSDREDKTPNEEKEQEEKPIRAATDFRADKEASIVSTITNNDPSERQVGELSKITDTFCPITAVSKFPYKYMQSSPVASEEVSRKYFAAGEFWTRHWTM